jgi:glycosidase
LGGLEGLRQLRQRLHAANIGLILDFVPNHTACDHAWVQTSPAYYIQGSPAQAAQAPGEYFHASPGAGSVYIAHGRDPFFPAWTDTAQLNYFNPEVHQVMREELLRIAQWCDGVRCDMAMLCLPDIFAQTWARVGFPPPNDFWGPTIATVQQYFPECCFIAEVYWQLQARLQRLGFTLTYDKDIYDALMEENPVKIRQLLDTAQEDLHGCVRFLENHDEPRVHQRFPLPQAEAAMLALLTLPGAVLLHEGQLDGRHYHTPVHLRRRRPEPSRPDVLHMYERLLTMPGPLEGIFTLLQPMPAGEHNHTFESLLAWAWWGANSAWLIVINYAPTAAQCWLEVRQIPWPSEVVWLQDHWQHTTYTRHREALQQQGLYIALPGFGSHLFTIHPSPSG